MNPTLSKAIWIFTVTALLVLLTVPDRVYLPYAEVFFVLKVLMLAGFVALFIYRDD